MLFICIYRTDLSAYVSSLSLAYFYSACSHSLVSPFLMFRSMGNTFILSRIKIGRLTTLVKRKRKSFQSRTWLINDEFKTMGIGNKICFSCRFHPSIDNIWIIYADTPCLTVWRPGCWTMGLPYCTFWFYSLHSFFDLRFKNRGEWGKIQRRNR